MMLPLPWACMARTSCFMLSTTPRTLVSNVAAKLSAVWSVIGPTWPSVAALFTATSRRPNRATVLSTIARTSSSLRTSALMNSAPEPSGRGPSPSAVPPSSRRPATTTLAPFLAKATAAARPMPVKPPVINTTGLLICNPRNQRPTGRVWKRTLWPRLRDRGQSRDAAVESHVVFSSAREKDFVSWRACLGDIESAMELRHLRYFIAVAEEGSLTLACEKRLDTAQPSLSRQIRDLEYEVGVQLMSRSVHGIELTAAGKAFLDHARLALTQAEAAKEAARRAAQPPRTLFAIGFLPGYEMDWLPAVMEILRAELPSTEVSIHSQDSPDLAAGLTHGKIDLAFMRPEKQASGLKFILLRKDPLIVLMPHDHALAARSSIRPQDIAGQTFIGVSPIRAPTVRAVIEDYARRTGLVLKPDHQAENLAMAISLVASTGGVSLLPLYAENLMPKTVVSRPIQGAPPMVDLVIGYNEANTSSLLKFLLSRLDELKFRVSKSDGR